MLPCPVAGFTCFHTHIFFVMHTHYFRAASPANQLLPGGKKHMKFLHVPGVVYPQQLLAPKPGCNPQTGKPYNKIPHWGINTKTAASLLHCSTGAARIALHRHKVRFCLVRTDTCPQQLFWSRTHVQRIADNKGPVCRSIPSGMVSVRDARRILGVTATSLSRYALQRMLSPVQVRYATRHGLRVFKLFHANEIEILRRAKLAWLRASDPMTPLKTCWENIRNEQSAQDVS